MTDQYIVASSATVHYFGCSRELMVGSVVQKASRSFTFEVPRHAHFESPAFSTAKWSSSEH